MQRLIRLRFVAAVAAALLLSAGTSRAEPDSEFAADPPAEPAPESTPEMAGEKPVAWFELGFWEDFQLFGPEFAVHGLRFNLGAARNREVWGVDLFGFGNLTSGDQIGSQFGFYNRVGGDLAGVQIAVLASEVEGRTRAVQLAGLFNRAREAGGVQIAAFLNRAKQVRGLQVALWNDAEDLAGVQIGLVNVVRNGWIPVFPLFNVGPLRRDPVPAADESPTPDEVAPHD